METRNAYALTQTSNRSYIVYPFQIKWKWAEEDRFVAVQKFTHHSKQEGIPEKSKHTHKEV